MEAFPGKERGGEKEEILALAVQQCLRLRTLREVIFKTGDLVEDRRN